MAQAAETKHSHLMTALWTLCTVCYFTHSSFFLSVYPSILFSQYCFCSFCTTQGQCVWTASVCLCLMSETWREKSLLHRQALANYNKSICTSNVLCRERELWTKIVFIITVFFSGPVLIFFKQDTFSREVEKESEKEKWVKGKTETVDRAGEERCGDQIVSVSGERGGQTDQTLSRDTARAQVMSLNQTMFLPVSLLRNWLFFFFFFKLWFSILLFVFISKPFFVCSQVFKASYMKKLL